MSHPDTEHTYQALRRAIIRAQEAGVRIICEANEVKTGAVFGCCATEAKRLFDPPLALSEMEKTSVERGFDGLAPRDWLHREMHEVGLRLRDEFSPITATELERELGVTL